MRRVFNLPRLSLRVPVVLVCVVATVALALGYAFVQIRSHYSAYDDEGFMLMTLKQYMGGARLYDEMYTEYGPFYYVAHSALFKSVGWGGTHDQLRLVSVVMWGLVASAWALCVWIWRQSVMWSLTAMMTTAVVLRALKWEPGHPQTLVLLLYGFVFMAASLYAKKAGPAAFAVLGAACAALLLTKINIGVFVCVPLVVAFTASVCPERRPSGVRATVTALCVALPAVLMHRQFTAPAVIVQCAVLSFGIWALLDRGFGNSPPEFPRAAGIWAAIGFASLGLFTLLATFAHGTSLSGLLDGLIFQPLRFSGAVPFPGFGVFEYIGLLCTLASAGLYLYARPRRGIMRPGVPAAVAFAMIVVAIGFPRLATDTAPAAMWILAPGPDSMRTSRYRVPVFFVTVAAMCGVLMTYPVPETQGYVAASIIVLAAFAALLYGMEDLMSAIRSTRLWFAASEQFVYGVIVLGTLGAGAWTVNVALNEVVDPADGHLPNSRLIPLSADQYQTFSELISRASSRCDALVTIPGMNSFHVWSGVPHPNGFLVSGTMVLFDAPTQQRLHESFVAVSRPCVIFNPGLERWSAQYRRMRSHQPFIDMVHDELATVYSRDGYEIRVPPAQMTAWR